MNRQPTSPNILSSCGSTRSRILAALLMIGLLTAAPLAAEEKERYVDSVITLLRLHAATIRQLATHDFKYSRNLVRHVSALQNTFGLLGPMEWHVASSSILLKRGSSDHPMTETDFDQMADSCQKSMKVLYQTALHRTESGGDGEPVIKALEEVQGKCNGCHTLLEDVAPDVWGPSNEK